MKLVKTNQPSLRMMQIPSEKPLQGTPQVNVGQVTTISQET